MKFNLTIQSLLQAKHDTQNFGFDRIISITDPGQEKPDLSHHNPKEIMRLDFHDITTSTPGADLFMGGHIKRIMDFQKRIQDNEKIMIHCHAGISRSSAVGIALIVASDPKKEEVETKSFNLLQKINPIMDPNKRIIEITDTAFRLEGRLISALAEFKNADEGHYLDPNDYL